MGSSRNAYIILILIYLIQVLIGYAAQFIKIPNYKGDFVKWITYICPAFRLGDFCIGGLAAYIFLRHKEKQTKEESIIIASLFEAISILIATLAQLAYINHWGYIGSPPFALSTLFSPVSVLLIVFFQGRGIFSKLISMKPFVFLGNMSSYAFLTHQVVIRYISSYFKKYYKISLTPGSKAMLAIMVTIVFCLAYQYIDNYFRTKQKNKSFSNRV